LFIRKRGRPKGGEARGDIVDKRKSATPPHTWETTIFCVTSGRAVTNGVFGRKKGQRMPPLKPVAAQAA